MSSALSEWLEVLFRWSHVVAGVLWIGLLYFFNFVNAVFAKTLDAESKPKVVPELLPRVLYFFRWGAAYTWVTGVLLLALAYYHRHQLAGATYSEVITMSALVALFVLGPMIYDLVWKAMAKNETAGVVVSFLLLAGAMAGMQYGLKVPGRSLYIHVGALFGTAMALNVWMRIWPAQRRIVAAIKAGKAPEAADPALAGLRSKHNTYMSVPLLFIMVSNHFAGLYGFQEDKGWLLLLGLIVLGWVVVKLLYLKAAGEAPKFF